MYQEEKEYNVIKGIIPDFGYDVKVAINVDGEKRDNIPSRGLYKTEVKCNNEAIGEWDYNAWNLKLSNITEETKCNLTFTSGLSKEEYDEYIEAGVSLRRNTYRGKDISKYRELEEENELNLYKQIKSCQFNDIYVGDYIKTNENGHEVTWLIADLNNYRYSGYTPLTECHATIIPATSLTRDQMNNDETADIVNPKLTLTTADGNTKSNIGAYMGSKMKQEVLPNILKEYIIPVFGEEHIITYTNLLTDQFDDSRSNQFGFSTGASSGWAWYESQIDLMSEVNVYGSTVWSSSGYDIGIDNRQYAIFMLKPEFIHSYGTSETRSDYWLKAVISKGGFAHVADSGFTNTNNASFSRGVRPRFLIN